MMHRISLATVIVLFYISSTGAVSADCNMNVPSSAECMTRLLRTAGALATAKLAGVPTSNAIAAAVAAQNAGRTLHIMLPTCNSSDTIALFSEMLAARPLRAVGPIVDPHLVQIGEIKELGYDPDLNFKVCCAWPTLSTGRLAAIYTIRPATDRQGGYMMAISLPANRDVADNCR